MQWGSANRPAYPRALVQSNGDIRASSRLCTRDTSAGVVGDLAQKLENVGF
jgi:hypothetical protein